MEEDSNAQENKIENTHEVKRRVDPVEEMDKQLNPWKIATIFLAVLLIASIYTNGFSGNDISSDGTTKDSEPTSDSDLVLTVVSDSRCPSCDANADGIISQLESMVGDFKVVKLDYSDDEGKEFYDENNLGMLPALLFNDAIEDSASYSQVQQYLTPVGEGLQELAVGSDLDPTKEICNNDKDDTDNGLVDCEDPDCDGEWQCMEKKDVPEVEVFVMSHCPFGTQMEKGAIPVAELMGNKIDFKVKFVNYAMHGQKEIDEQLRQYCIQEEQQDKYLKYLRCFLGSSSGTETDSTNCMKEAGVSISKVDSCVEATDKEFGIMEAYNDKSTWKGSFPSFNIHNAENIKYGVRGSPHIVINGVSPSISRDSRSILDAVCTAFKVKPAECDKDIDASSPSPGFGWTTTTAPTGSAVCG